MNRTVAVADIGGTHARFALAELDGGSVASLGEAVILRTADYEDLGSAWTEFCNVAGCLPDTLSLAFAGSIGGKRLKLTNSQWLVQPDLLATELGIDQLLLVNDFGAVAHAVAELGPEHFDHLFGPEGQLPETGVTTVIGPGTGLGVAQLLRAAGSYQVIETEGGHIDFAALDPAEERILSCMRSQFSRVSVERIVSGSGLANLYRAMAAIEGEAAELAGDEMIWNAALNGSDPLAVAALDRFFLSFGAVAGDLALAHGSNAVVIAGGLAHRFRQGLVGSGFEDCFVAKGRFEGRMATIPIKLLNHPQPGLYGAAAAFAKEHP